MLTTFLLLFLLQTPPSEPFLDVSIATAREKIAKEPASPEGYNELALALARKERETGDAALLTAAGQAIQKSLSLQPANFEARKARVAVRLRQKRYEDALEEAQALNKQTPDDNPVYGFLSEAQIALGNYQEAENAVQFMLNLRQVNGPGHERGAILRELIGFPDAAIDWWNSAYHLSSDRDTEERAFIQSQMIRVYREMGKYDSALESARQALAIRPEYPPAQFELARVLLDQGKARDAAVLLRSLLKKQTNLEAEYYLAQASPAAEGKTQWAVFEKQARAAVGLPANANALLVRYLADNGKADEAVEIAREAVKRRHNLFLLHSLAWAQYRAGDAAAALATIRKALAPGFKDAGLYYDAGTIAKAAHEDAAALGYFKKAYEINSNAPTAAATLKQLASLSPGSE